MGVAIAVSTFSTVAFFFAWRWWRYQHRDVRFEYVSSTSNPKSDAELAEQMRRR